jgi:hypothetical protein
MRSARLLPLLALLISSACTGRSASDAADVPLELERTTVAAGTMLRVIPPEGVRLSAAVKPVLRLERGDSVRFDTAAVSGDSLYYTAPPAGLFTGPASELRGVLHAGICDLEAATCRKVTVRI